MNPATTPTKPPQTYSETRAACAAYMAIGFASGLRDSDKEAVKSGGRAKNEALIALLEECAVMLLAKAGETHTREAGEPKWAYCPSRNDDGNKQETP